MPATTVRQKAKRVPARDAVSVIIDIFSLVICVFSLFLTVILLSVWQPIGLWVCFFGLIGLTVYHVRAVFEGWPQLIDMFAGFWRVLRNLWPRGVADAAGGKKAGRHPAETTPASRKTAAPSARIAKRTVSRRRSASR